MTIPKSKLAKSVAEEISTSVSHYYFWWRVWNSLSITATVTSIVVSFIASVVAATRSIQHPAWAAVVAGLPAVILSLSQTIRFAERADWFWNLIVQYQSLQRAIKRGDLTIADASRFIDEIEINANAIDPSREKPAVINPATNTPAIPQKKHPTESTLVWHPGTSQVSQPDGHGERALCGGLVKWEDLRPLLDGRTMGGLDSVFNPVRRFSRGCQE